MYWLYSKITGPRAKYCKFGDLNKDKVDVCHMYYLDFCKDSFSQVYNGSLKEHEEHLRIALASLSCKTLYANFPSVISLSKNCFWSHSLDYVGQWVADIANYHRISGELPFSNLLKKEREGPETRKFSTNPLHIAVETDATNYAIGAALC